MEGSIERSAWELSSEAGAREHTNVVQGPFEARRGEQRQRGKNTTKTSTTIVWGKYVYIVLQLMNKQASF